MSNTSVNYERWKKVLYRIQLVMAGLILVAEVFGNIMLYLLQSQGYGPETIVGKLLRYLVLTTMINYGAIIIGQLLIRRVKNVNLEKYILIMVLEVLCFNTAFSHYQFTIVYSIYTIPVALCVLYEDPRLSRWTTIVSSVALAICVGARALDPVYNRDVAIEGCCAHIMVLTMYLVCRMCQDTLTRRREELEEAMEASEKTKYLEKVEEMSLEMVRALSSAIDAKDKYTNGHSFRVAEYAAIMAQELGWDKEKINALRYEAYLHDVGKIGIPDSVLNKNGKLTETEFNVIRSHTTIGADILKSITGLPGAQLVARGHHERYDGTGYPDGLSGEAIPISARIVGLSDAFDAMNSDRVYRKALTPEVIRRELEKGRGTQFDPELLDVFIRLWDEGRLRIKNPYEASGRPRREVPEAFIQDLNEYIREVASQGEYQGALSVEYQDFSKIFAYLKKLGDRYGHSLEVVMICLKPQPGMEILEDDMDMASGAMDLAIRKNIRTVDVSIRYSRAQFLTVMLDAGVENIDTIMQRIFMEYYKLCGNKKLEPFYEVN